MSRWTSRLNSLRWNTGWVARCRVVSPMPAGSRCQQQAEAGWLARMPVPLKGRLDHGRMSCLFFLDTETDGENKALPTILTHGPWYLLLVVSRSESLSQVGSLGRELDNSR